MGVFSTDIQRARRLARRSRSAVACARCKTAKRKCSDFRPCKHCFSLKASCIDPAIEERVSSAKKNIQDIKTVYPTRSLGSTDSNDLKDCNKNFIADRANVMQHVQTLPSTESGFISLLACDPYPSPFNLLNLQRSPPDFTLSPFSGSTALHSTPQRLPPLFQSMTIRSAYNPVNLPAGFPRGFDQLPWANFGASRSVSTLAPLRFPTAPPEPPPALQLASLMGTEAPWRV